MRQRLKIVFGLASLQKQLDPSYLNDKFLRDRVMKAVDTPSIQISMWIKNLEEHSD